MSGRKIGTLVVVVVRATYLHNKSLLRKQDPYCVLRLGDQTLRTNAIKHGGQRPEWNEELRFSIYETAEEELARTGGKGAADAPLPPPQTDAKAKDPSERTMHLSCYAEHFKKPDFIGETTFDPTEALRKGEMDGYFTLRSKKRFTGEVHLEMTYRSERRRPPNQPRRKPLPDIPPSPPIDRDQLLPYLVANFDISTPPYGRDAAPQRPVTVHPGAPGYNSRHGRGQSHDGLGQGVYPRHNDEVRSSLSGLQPAKSLPVRDIEQSLLGLRSPERPESSPVSNTSTFGTSSGVLGRERGSSLTRTESDGGRDSLIGWKSSFEAFETLSEPCRALRAGRAPPELVMEIERSLFGPQSPRSLPPSSRSHSSQSSHGSIGRGSYGAPFSADGMASSVIGDPSSAQPESSQPAPFTDVPLPYYPSSGFGPVLQQTHVFDSSSTGFRQPPPVTIGPQPTKLSTFPDSMIPIDDIGFAITCISPTPVKVNGHFCDVFEGIHGKAGRVALKRPRIGATGYDDVVVRRFEREAATWRKLRHPHILEFLGTFKRDGHMYFVSPFISNGTLVEYIAEHPDINRIRLLCETADAVKYLHKEAVIHGDIKASNILIGDNGYSLLCDFGLTKTVESRTSTAMRGAGTFRWQGPELWDNAPKSFKSDVYAFGMTIVEVLTGEVPFHDLTNDMAVMYAVILRDERPSKIPAESSNGISYENVWDVASACWPRTPSDRIPMFEAFQRIRTDPSLASSHQS